MKICAIFLVEVLKKLLDNLQQLQNIDKQQKQDKETIETLCEFLPRVSAIHGKYVKEKERQVTQFNIFSILCNFGVLRGERDEVNLHSRFICYLLDPSEDHKQDAQFLRHFLQTEGLAEFFTEEEIANASIEKEKFHIAEIIGLIKILWSLLF